MQRLEPPHPGPHPGPHTVRLPGQIAAQIVAQAQAEAPLEACGLIPGTAAAAQAGLPLRYEPCRNAAASRTRYEVSVEDYLRVQAAIDADSAGGDIWGIAHSHPVTAAVPSGLDVAKALHPDALYLVVSLAGSEPELRAWRILNGVPHEVALDIS